MIGRSTTVISLFLLIGGCSNVDVLAATETSLVQEFKEICWTPDQAIVAKKSLEKGWKSHTLKSGDYIQNIIDASERILRNQNIPNMRPSYLVFEKTGGGRQLFILAMKIDVKDPQQRKVTLSNCSVLDLDQDRPFTAKEISLIGDRAPEKVGSKNLDAFRWSPGLLPGQSKIEMTYILPEARAFFRQHGAPDLRGGSMKVEYIIRNAE